MLIDLDRMLVETLSPVNPLVFANIYAGGEREYITYTYYTAPVMFADDEPDTEKFNIAVSFFAPPGKNVLSVRRRIKEALFSAGFTYPTETPASDLLREGTGYQCWVYECDIVG